MVFIGIFPKVLKIFLMFFVLLVIILAFPFFFFLPDTICILEYRHLKLLFHHGSFCIFHGFGGVNCQLF